MSLHGEQDHFAPFKKYELILNSRSESFENKIIAIVEVWKNIAELDFVEFGLRHVIQIMDWAKLHALNTVLTAEWNRFKDKYQNKLLEEIEKAQNEVLKVTTLFATSCEKLADVVRNPWEDPTLMKLMKCKDAEIGSAEIEFFCMETAYLVSVRLKKLCESHCEDLALNLVAAYMTCHKLSKQQNFDMSATETQMWFIFDIYIALLYKFQEKQKMVTLLKELSFNDGLQLVNRFSKKRVKISKIWKNCNRIAIFATQMYISQLLLRYSNDLQSTLEEYIELYISLCDPDNLEDFSDSIRRISNLAEGADGLYVFCDVIQQKERQKLKPFIIEMYIRALTSDMNELERHKDANDTEKVQIITQRLANAFVSLAHVLDEHVNVARECVLTAFSLAPTSDKLKKIEELARRSGYQVVLSRDEWKCKLHPPVLPSDDVTWICTQCGDLMCKPSLELPKINIALHEALQNSVLGISEALCDDLVVCLSNPRYQVLSWFLPWNDLHRICLMYLEDPQKTKSIVTELKFIDIDYSIFQNIKKEPEEEGIERGYEQYIEPDEESVSNSVDSMSQESRPYSLGSDGAGDNVFLSRLPSIPQKSDPNTLKSLRMFRPNLKRVKEKDLGESSPEKLFKPCTIVRESQASTSHQNLSSGSSEVLPSTSSTGKSIDESKNVKTATLPQLGGQVARTQIKATQKRQKLTLKDLLTSSMNPAHREPRKLSKKSSTSAEQTHNQETQNKSLLIGSKGNNKQKLSKEEKANPQKPLKLVVEIPREDLQQRKMTLIRQHSVLPSKQGSVIRPSEQTTSTKSPPLVVKVPLIRYPPHPRHRKATLAMQNSTQQIKSVEELRLPPLAPLSTQQKINSHTSATQLITLLQQKSQSASQALTPAHIQTGSKQGSLCLTESSSKEYPSLLDNQPKAPVTANTHQAGPSCSYQQSLLPGNIVGYQPVTLPQTQSEISLTTQVAGVVSTSQIVQETVDDIFQPTAQGISFSPINPAVPQSDSLSPTEQGELVRLEDSLIESRDLQVGKEILAHMQEIQEINKSLQREQSPHPTLLLKHLQPVEAAPTCPGIKSLPTSQEQNPDSYPDPTPAEWFPLVPCSRTTSLKSQETSVAPPKHPQPVGAFSEIRSPLKEMNLAPQQKSIADSPPLVTTEVNHQSSREQTMDSSLRQPSSSDSFQQLISRLPEPSPQMVPTLEEALSGLFPCPTIAAMECPTPITSETECQGTSRVITDDVSQTTGIRKKIWQGYNPPPVRFVTAQDTRLLHPETRATSQEAASHLQQLSPLSILIVDSPPPQTIVIADSPPPQTITSETESHLEKQGQPSAPTYQETSHLQTGIGPTPACPKQLRIVISPNTQKAASQFQAKRRSMSPVTEPQKHHCAKRVGQEDSSIALPRKRGRPRKKPVERRKTRISVPEKPPLLTILDQQESRLSPVSEERLEWGRAMIAEICKPEWPAAIKWPHGDVRNMIDASQTLQDFFSQRRAQSPGLHRQIHTHSTKYLNYFPPTRQPKEEVPYLAEENEDLWCLKDPTREQPVIAVIQGQICLFQHKCLRTGGGLPSILYQQVIQRRKKHLEIWSSDSENSESELEEDMEDMCRPKSVLLVIEQDPFSWTVLMERTLPRTHSRTLPAAFVKTTFPRPNPTARTEAAYLKPSTSAVDEYIQQPPDPADLLKEKRIMRKVRRMIRREKAEHIIEAEVKRMSDRAIDEIRNSELDEPISEVVDVGLFIDFLQNRGDQPLRYRKVKLSRDIAGKAKEVPCSSKTITKEVVVNVCRLSAHQLQELTSKKDTAEDQATTKEKSCCQSHGRLMCRKSGKKCDCCDLSGNSFASKRKSDDSDSDLENSNLENSDQESNQRASCDTNQLDKKEPRVLLENKTAKSLLANVPGLNDFHLMQPQNVDQIINVAQVPGTKTQMQTTSQTSTPVTAHIQRVGQPRPSEQKPENSTPLSTNISNVVATTSSAGHTTTKTQPSTLINILSQQVIRPANIVPSGSTIAGNSNGHTSSTNTTSTSSSGNSSSTTTPTRRPPFINILSQQIIRPTQASKGAPNNGAYTVTETVLPKPPVTEPVSSTTNNQTRPTITTTTIIPKTTSIVTTSGLAGNISSSIPDSASNTSGTAVGNSQGSTIVQFICKSALPKFQQAFGKTVYQCTTETTESSTVSESSNAPTATICTIPVSTVTPSTEVKKNPTNVAKAVPVNVQSIQGNVIYSRQVPVGQTINLVPPTGATRQVFRIATSNPEQLSLVKDSVIHSKMSALLAAALQSRPKNTETEIQVQDDGTKITLTRPALVQNARIVKPVQLQLPTNVVRAPQPNLSSTTLEQLREFDMVYKQIKERSSNTTPTEISSGEQTQEVATPQRISVTYVNQLPKYTQLSPVVVVSSYSHLQQAATSPALSVTSQSSLSPCTTPTSTPSTAPKITTKTTKALIVGKTFKNHTNNSTTKTSPISKPQQKPQEDEHTTQRIFDILAEYAEQLRNSPDLNNKPAPRRRSNPPTNPSQNSKRKKSSSSTKKTAPANSNVEIDTDDITVGSEDSSGGGMIQLSVTDDEQSQSQAATTSTVESSEATTPTCPRQVILTDNASVGTQPRNVIIADSTVGEALKMSNTAVIVPGSYIMPVSMVKGGQQIAVMSGGSKILATVPARSGQNMLLFQSFTNQNRKGAISAVKYSSLQSVSGISSQSIAGVSAQPPVILPSNSVATAVAIGQQLSLKKIGEEREGSEVLLAISQKEDTQPDSVTSVSSDSEDVKIPDQSNVKVDQPNEKIIHTYQKPISTNKAYTVIATSINAQKVHQEPCAQPSVISTTKVSTTLNGPMLSHTTTNRFRKMTDSERTIIRGSEAKEDSTHNGAKVIHTEPKTYRSSAIYYTNKAKKVTIDSQKPESDAQKQAMLERELRLQKSLSEECEDLGVDEPSTSDLFPEADLLFDSNHSPSFDHNSQEVVKKGSHGTEKEEGTKSSINLFSDDDNSSSLKSDLFEYVEYHTVESALDHQAKQLMNGNNPETESPSCEDNTLLPKCSNMSEVTLNSPISPEVYAESSVNKYKFKYTNRKKSEKTKQSDSSGETITNSEDAVSSADSCKLSNEEETYKVVHVAITKSDMAKEESRCELHVCEEFVDSPSGRGARRSVRKLCSCCNGAQDGHHAARKRPNPSRPQTPATLHKKPFLKKR